MQRISAYKGDYMKKIFLIILLLIVCGCKYTTQYSQYEHYNLNENDGYLFNYTFHDEYGIPSTYVVTILEERDYEDITVGLFFKISQNDYVLLDKINSCNEKEIDVENTYFYYDSNQQNNKLYLQRCIGNKNIEYVLDKEKIIKKELLFDKKIADLKETSIVFNKIKKVEDNYIYYVGYNVDSVEREELSIKCSLIDYLCTLEAD